MIKKVQISEQRLERIASEYIITLNSEATNEEYCTLA